MANFKTGQKVVCKDDKNPNTKIGAPKGIIAGKVYEICGLDKCEFCGLELIMLVGVNSGSRKECLCSEIPILPTNAFAAYRFEPIKYETNKASKTDKKVVTECVGNVL